MLVNGGDVIVMDSTAVMGRHIGYQRRVRRLFVAGWSVIGKGEERGWNGLAFLLSVLSFGTVRSAATWHAWGWRTEKRLYKERREGRGRGYWG